MNRINFNQTGGFPLKTERLQELQTAFEIFNAYGALAGNFTVISGCETVGTTVQNGFVFINNELLEFREASVNSNSRVVIIEQVASKTFQNGQLKPVHYVRYATFGTAATSWPWTGFKRINPIVQLMQRLDTLEKKTAVFQSGGGMVLWNKPANEIPQGWQEVVNWRGRIPVGFDSTQPEFNEIGETGGAKSKTLSITEMPQHSHGYGDIYHSEYGGNIPTGSLRGSDATDWDNAGYEVQRTSQSSGGSQAFSIMNPYRVVMFIEYIG